MTSKLQTLKTWAKSTRAGPYLREARALISPIVRRLSARTRLFANDFAGVFGSEVWLEEPLHIQWKKILRTESPLMEKTTPDGERVLLATTYGFSPTKLAFESILAAGLRLKGASPISLVCDKTLSAWEFNPFGNFRPSPGEFGPKVMKRGALETCARCTSEIEDVFGPLLVPMLRLSHYVKPNDLVRLSRLVEDVRFEEYRGFRYKEVGVGEHAFSTALRTTLRGTLVDDARTRWLFRRLLVSSMHLVDLMERLIESESPQKVVAVHGVYLTHGTICEVARREGIPVIIFGIPYRQGTVWLSHEDTYHRTLIAEPHEIWEETPLTNDEERVLQEYLDSKLGGGRDYVNYHPNPVEDQDKIRQELDLDDRPIITLYTNVLFDAQIYYKFNAFDNMLEWIFATIDYFAKRDDLQLAIRIHPAEVKGELPSNQPISDEILSRYVTLPENVHVVGPESDISSYILGEMSHAALIYGTKLGLELAIRGVPVVVAGETFNRSKGFTYDISTQQEYFELLDRIDELPRNSPMMIERARRYAYYLFFKRMMDFDLFRVQEAHHSVGLRLNFQTLSELSPGANRTLDVICDGILKGSPFVLDPEGVVA